MSSISDPHSPTPILDIALSRLRDNWGWFLALGLGLIVLGIYALAQSVLFTLASMWALGGVMIVAAILSVVAAFRGRGWQHFLLWVLAGVLYGIAGFLMISQPLLASGVATLFLGAIFFASGVLRLWLGVKARPNPGWVWLCLGGALAVILALMIAFGWPANSLWLIGTLLGVEMIVQGWTYVTMGLALRLR